VRLIADLQNESTKISEKISVDKTCDQNIRALAGLHRRARARTAQNNKACFVKSENVLVGQ
jgi:hypothetical protein